MKAASFRAALCDLKNDPEELQNLIDDPRQSKRVAQLQNRLTRLIKDADGWPDKMPMDEGVKAELPDQRIR